MTNTTVAEKQLTVRELRKYANDFLRRNFNMNLMVDIEINNRLTRACGRMKYRQGAYVNSPISIELSGHLLRNNPTNMVLDILYHELVHYALCVQKLPFSDGDKVFEDKLKELGVVSQDTMAEKYPNLKLVDRGKIVYQCVACGTEIHRQRRIAHDGKFSYHKVCGKEGKLKRIK